jgi:hypothetical protein
MVFKPYDLVMAIHMEYCVVMCLNLEGLVSSHIAREVVVPKQIYALRCKNS